MSSIDLNTPAIRDVLDDCEYLDGADLDDGDGYVPENNDEKVDVYLRDVPGVRHLIKADSWERNRGSLVRTAALVLNEIRRLDRIHAASTATEED